MPVPVAARLLRSWVRIPPGACMFVCCESFVLSGIGLFDGLISRPEEYYRVWYVVVFDPETLRMRGPWPALGRSATGKKIYMFNSYFWCSVNIDRHFVWRTILSEGPPFWPVHCSSAAYCLGATDIKHLLIRKNETVVRTKPPFWNRG